MAKGYWIAFYKAMKDPEKFAAYAKIAPKAIEAAGGRFVVRGAPAKVYEHGLNQRVVMIEFDSVTQAIAAHDSAGYQEALRVLGDGVEREIRIVEALG
jgi:uncharacterized protein (DUF1330 family)